MDLSQKTNDIGSVFEAAPANLSIAPSHHDKAITSINISVTHSQVSEACSVSRFNTGPWELSSIGCPHRIQGRLSLFKSECVNHYESLESGCAKSAISLIEAEKVGAQMHTLAH